MFQALHAFFGADQFMPHGMCYLWQPGVLGLHVVSDGLITAAYLSIPFTLAHFLRRRRDLEFNWVIGCFAVFIVACGATHLMEIVTIWTPIYWVSGAIKAVTAAASVPTAILLVKMMPMALSVPSPKALNNANRELQLVNATLRAQALEQQRMERELQQANQKLHDQLRDMRGLHELSTRLIQATELPQVLDEILAATVALQQADFGAMQLLDKEAQALRFVAQRGFSKAILEEFESVAVSSDTVASRVFRERRRVIVEDVELDTALEYLLQISRTEGYRGLQVTPIMGRDGQVKGLLSTAFKQPHRSAESDLQLTDLYVRLAAELLERMQYEEALREARDEADRANEAKSRFLATASHDLRQPLQVLSLLNGSLQRLANAECLPAVEEQRLAIGGMSRLLSALLDVSKLESGMVRPEPQNFEVTSLIEEMRVNFAGTAASKGLVFEVEGCDASIHSDRSLVGQIVGNLLSNAIKYTREGSVQLRCREEGGLVCVEVRDTGVGIETEHIPYIFDEFYQVGVPTDVAREGYGLGLSIVQRLVKLLALRLDVKSAPGAGSVFSLFLPTVEYVAQIAVPAIRDSFELPAIGQLRVLLVDDDAAVRSATRLLLSVEGYLVTDVGSVAEALAHASERFDLLITDYHLQRGETGLDLIATMREACGYSLKCVLITGDTSSAVKNMPHDPLVKLASKPIEADELLMLLRALVAA
jgi:signal transduction histidine kinase